VLSKTCKIVCDNIDIDKLMSYRLGNQTKEYRTLTGLMVLEGCNQVVVSPSIETSKGWRNRQTEDS